ncbi:hypothetical protein GW796_11480 [archaeon]|nr:hypothetical protein [archaeon]
MVFLDRIINLLFLKKDKITSVDVVEINEIKKKLSYIETDIFILKEQYDALIGRTRANEMKQARGDKKQDDLDIKSIIADIVAGKGQNLEQLLINHPKIVEKFLK